MRKPLLPLDTDKAFGVSRPAPKPSQSTKKQGRKTKETVKRDSKTK